MGIFNKRDRSLEMLKATIIGQRVAWESYQKMPAKNQQATLANMPQGLRDQYRKAAAVDRGAAKALIDQARAKPPTSEPPSMSWQALLDYAVSD